MEITSISIVQTGFVFSSMHILFLLREEFLLGLGVLYSLSIMHNVCICLDVGKVGVGNVDVEEGAGAVRRRGDWRTIGPHHLLQRE